MGCHEVTELAHSDKALAPAEAEGVVSVQVEAGGARVASPWDLVATAFAQVAVMA